MPINLTTEKLRRLYHQRTLEIMAKLERTVSNKLKPMINRQYMDAATLITQGVTDVEHVVGLQRARLFNILKAHYHRVALIAGRQAIMNFDPAKSMGDAFWNDINTYVALNTGRKVKSMQDTTTKIISKTIKQGVEEGETNREIATRLRGKGKTLSTFQALRIARTETLGMYNSATEASINETGLKFKRIWSASMDMRTRRRKKGSPWDHWEANGQERKQGEDFLVSGEPLSFPGDPKGSAGNIINCRCVLLYERDRSNEMQPRPISGALPVDVGLPVITEPKPVSEELTWKPVTNIEDIETQARQKLKIGGINAFEYSGKQQIEMSNLVGNELAGVLARNPKLNKLIADMDPNFDLIGEHIHSIRIQKRKYVNETPGAVGGYVPAERVIYIGGKNPLKQTALKIGEGNWEVEKSVLGTTRHEYGHWLHLNSPAGLKSKWHKLLKENDLFPKDNPTWWRTKVSSYAKTSVDESFAESFAAYTHINYGVKKRLPKVIEEFFDINIKGK